MIPSVSIITSVYNVERFFEKCLRSLFGQTFESVEFVFVNDYTPDNSMVVLDKVLNDYPQRKAQVKIVNHERNRGVASAKNTGLEAATGEYVIMIDSDDWVEPDMLEKMVAKAKENDADIVVADYYLTYAQGERRVEQSLHRDGREDIKALFMAELHGSNGNKLVRRSLYTGNGIAFFEGLNMWEDLVTSVQLFFFAGKIAHIPQAFLHYVQTNSGSYTRQVSEQSLQNMITALELIELFLKRHSVYDEYEESLCYLKLTAKLNLLVYGKRSLQKQRNSLYPETSGIIMKQGRISMLWRVALTFASRGMLPVFNIMAYAGNKLKS